MGENDEERMELMFKDLTMTVDTINGEKTILDSISGSVPPRSLTALMGGSGGGKISLLNSLSGREELTMLKYQDIYTLMAMRM